MKNRIYTKNKSELSPLKIIILLFIVVAGGLYLEQDRIRKAILPNDNDIKQMIKEVIIHNPTIIIDAIKEAQQKEREELANSAVTFYKNNKQKIEQDNISPKIGKKDAPIKLVYFSDYNCKYCNIFSKMLANLSDQYKDIEIIYKNSPILGEDSYFAAKTAVALNKLESKKFKLLHEKLNSTRMTREQLVKFVISLGISDSEYEKIMNNQELDEELMNNMQFMKRLNIGGTPALLINGKLVTERSEEAIKNLIELEKSISSKKHD